MLEYVAGEGFLYGSSKVIKFCYEVTMYRVESIPTSTPLDFRASIILLTRN